LPGVRAKSGANSIGARRSLIGFGSDPRDTARILANIRA
jgi:hypothetical protein